MPSGPEETRAKLRRLKSGDTTWIREEMEEVMLSKTNSVAQDDEIADVFGAMLVWSCSRRGTAAISAWDTRQASRGRDRSLIMIQLRRVRERLHRDAQRRGDA
jgi:hypothetical protein